MTPPLRTILVIDDEPALRHMLRLVLEQEGYGVREADSAAAGLAALDAADYAAILCDIRMPGLDGLAFLREAAKREQLPTVIMMSAYGSIDTALACMKEGAYDYISKPFKPDEVILTLRKAEERLRLQQENRSLREELARGGAGRELICCGPAMQKVATTIRRVAEAGAAVLVSGETGTGKELVARAIHRQSSRSERPFVAVNCGAMPATLIESELFGHSRGAFTGADRERPGLFAAANGGTLFLDEIGELPLELQPKLLRVLQEGEVQRLGDPRPHRVDVRVIAATARNLRDEVAARRFRDDLFYRLAVVEIVLPPLRERPEEIPGLVAALLQRLAARERRAVPVLTPRALSRLQAYSWPGNVRELENLLEKSLIFCRKSLLDLGDLPLDAADLASPREPLRESVGRAEALAIRRALAACGGNRAQTAQLLDISLRSLLYKLKEHDIE